MMETTTERPLTPEELSLFNSWFNPHPPIVVPIAEASDNDWEQHLPDIETLHERLDAQQRGCDE